MIDQFVPSDPALLRNPYPTFAKYREADPVHWGKASMSGLPGSWYLFRYEENVAVLNDQLLFASDPATVGMAHEVPDAFKPIAKIHQRWLGGIDPPDHRRLRQIMAKAFTPKRIGELEPRVQQITTTLADEAIATSTDGSIDVWRQVAFPMPMNVIGDAVGVHKEDWITFQQWSQDISDAVDRAGDAEAGKKGADAILGMYAYFENLIEERKTKPVDDLFNAMMTAADDDGQPMTQFDAIAIATELGLAGHETTTNGLSLSVYNLLLQEGSWEKAQEGLKNPAKRDAILEELLRITAPVQRQRWRWATSDTKIADREVKRGESVVSLLGAANRDPAVFPDPDRIDFDRPKTRHLTFGLGAHFCLGNHLAKLELGTGLDVLGARFPKLQFAVDPAEIPFNHNYLLPGPASLPVKAG